MNVSIFKELLKSKDVPYIISLDKCLERIKSGKTISKDICLKIRSEKDDETIKKLKNSLPCILFAGEFSERNKNGLVKHSGLMVVDFDKFETPEKMNNHFELLKKNEHFYSIFLSPSGNGLKGVIKIPICDKINHEKYFKEFQKTFNYDYWDKSNCNVDRVCFESYDPDIYINKNATTFNPILVDSGYTYSERVPIIPIENEDVIVEKIMKFNFKKDFVEGERNNFIFDIAGLFCEYGVSQSYAENYILNNVVIGNFSETEAKNAIKSSYKKRDFGSKYFENFTKINSIKNDLNKGKKAVIEKYKINEEVYNEIVIAEEIKNFWYINEKGKISISNIDYKRFLERNGFKKHYPNGAEKHQFVYIESNKVEISSVPKIKDFVLNYLLEKNEFEVYNYCASFNNLFMDNYLILLDTIDLVMLNDTKDKSYIPYKNGILEVSKNKVELIDYIDIEYYIWKSQILNRDFTFYNNLENDYKTFIYNISNKEPLPLETTIGYLLSTYKNRSNNKAVILNDEVISENPEGGTGKGLFVQGIGHIRKTSIIDGKQFDTKKSFPYQTVSLDTKVLVFDDVKKNFDFEQNFSLVTEGLTLEQKNKDAIKLNIHESPKLIISTNYAIRGEGNSHNRRRLEIEVAQYYGSKIEPADEFGRQVFDDWDEQDFNRFDNYMVYCLQMFLNNGIIKQNAKNIKLRKFIAETNIDFYNWISDAENFELGKRNDKDVIFEKFIKENPDFSKFLKRNTFTIWVQKYANFIGLNYEQNQSNGQKWFAIFKNELTDDGVPF